MKKYLLLAMCSLLLSWPSQAQKKDKKEVKQEVKVDSAWRSITFTKATQARLTELRERYEELIGVEKLIKKNEDLKLFVQQRITSLGKEYQAQYLTLYETNGISAPLVKRDSIVEEVLWLKFNKPPSR